MDERRAIGQHLFTGFEGLTLSPQDEERIREARIGNVILFARNVGTAEQTRALCDRLQAVIGEATGLPALIAIDQEGGIVSRLGSDCALVPSAMAIAATGDPDCAYQAGLLTGQELRALGVNLDLAPVADVNSNPDNPVIGVRSYGGTPDTVARFALPMARGLQDAGLLCCAKHFPGHGDTAVDSHVGLPQVDKPLDQLLACELEPFRRLIGAGVPAVMSSHILFPQLEPERVPATMSRAVMTGLLRERLGFQGLVLSDCMMMGAISDHYGTLEGTLAALRAGVDMAFLSHSTLLAQQAARLLLSALRDGQLDRRALHASTDRILRVKAALPPAAPLQGVGSEAHVALADRLHERSLTAVRLPQGGMPPLGPEPLFIGCLPYRATQASSPALRQLSFADFMQARLGGTALTMSEDPDAAEVGRIAGRRGHSSVVIGTCNGHQRRGQTELVRAMADGPAPVVCAALRNPYDLAGLPPQVTAIAAYAYSEPALRALARLLAGEIGAPGRLPVSLAG